MQATVTCVLYKGMGASAVSDQDEFYMYLWLFLSRNSEKQHCSQPKSRSIASYWQQKRCWSETADAPSEPVCFGILSGLAWKYLKGFLPDHKYSKNP